MPIQSEHYDCVVVGGGPAGSATAALVAEAGYQTLLLERESVPRFHVGESLMPETYWCFERLGVLEKMKQSDYVQKASVQFVSSSGKESSPFFFDQHDPRESSRTWQVERAEFDRMLFENAAEKGAECVDQTRVLRVLMEEGVARGVQVQQDDGPPREITARVVVDATGQQALIANQQGIRKDDQDLKKVAIWNYFRGAFRSPGEQGGSMEAPGEDAGHEPIQQDQGDGETHGRGRDGHLRGNGKRSAARGAQTAEGETHNARAPRAACRYAYGVRHV